MAKYNILRTTKIKGIKVTISQDEVRPLYYKFNLRRGTKSTTITTKVSDNSILGMQELVEIYLEDFLEDEKRQESRKKKK